MKRTLVTRFTLYAPWGDRYDIRIEMGKSCYEVYVNNRLEWTAATVPEAQEKIRFFANWLNLETA